MMHADASPDNDERTEPKIISNKKWPKCSGQIPKKIFQKLPQFKKSKPKKHGSNMIKF